MTAAMSASPMAQLRRFLRRYERRMSVVGPSGERVKPGPALPNPTSVEARVGACMPDDDAWAGAIDDDAATGSAVAARRAEMAPLPGATIMVGTASSGAGGGGRSCRPLLSSSPPIASSSTIPAVLAGALRRGAVRTRGREHGGRGGQRRGAAGVAHARRGGRRRRVGRHQELVAGRDLLGKFAPQERRQLLGGGRATEPADADAHRLGEAAGGGEAAAGIPRQRLGQRGPQAWRDVGPTVPDLGQGVLGDGLERQEVGLAVEQALDRQQLEHDRTEREHVAAAVERLAEDLLGRHVRVLALHRAGAGARVGATRLGDAEVEHLHGAAVDEHDVGRRHIAVDHAEQVASVVARLVGVVQAVAGLDDDAGDDAEVDQRLALGEDGEHPRQRHAVQVLHRDVPGGVVVPEREHPTHVRVDQASRPGRPRRGTS
jgi:hypothetical protein